MGKAIMRSGNRWARWKDGVLVVRDFKAHIDLRYTGIPGGLGMICLKRWVVDGAPLFEMRSLLDRPDTERSANDEANQH